MVDRETPVTPRWKDGDPPNPFREKKKPESHFGLTVPPEDAEFTGNVAMSDPPQQIWRTPDGDLHYVIPPTPNELEKLRKASFAADLMEAIKTNPEVRKAVIELVQPEINSSIIRQDYNSIPPIYAVGLRMMSEEEIDQKDRERKEQEESKMPLKIPNPGTGDTSGGPPTMAA